MDTMQSFIQHYGYFAHLRLSRCSPRRAIPIPTEVVYGFAGALCTTAITGTRDSRCCAIIVVGTMGSLVGAIIAYEVGRSAGRTIVDRWGKWILLTHKDLDAARTLVRASTASISVLVSRVLPVVRSFISVPAGMAEMNRARFAVLTTIGSAGVGRADRGARLRRGLELEARLARTSDALEIPIIIADRHRARAWASGTDCAPCAATTPVSPRATRAPSRRGRRCARRTRRARSLPVGPMTNVERMTPTTYLP